MADTRKNVLVAGMGHFVSADWEQQGKNGQQNTNRQTVVDVILPRLHPAQRSDVSQEMERAKAEGYDYSLVDVNPEDPEDTLRRIKEVLQKRHCDIFMIGFAVRGNPKFTSMFEQLVNTSVEVSPKTKFGFFPKPDEVYSTLVRISS
ncbi:hypothetical protein CB0940_10758 [Cercospora beticola]|uniref:Uncharacterized protein n=1 Tax=Cercospora beticola TaxID=122368 RepID=A0A2G5HUC2_CERBT|nr:hypothetical protein CB0940_10758 [Cercospora beticola]PIA95822.1 hypothetical protein CB0940_10758 [Cercospora beticola]WPB07487.1 hypothetical protein RHO25_012148 [Cercospora beticola]